jgi:hypothetical protein
MEWVTLKEYPHYEISSSGDIKRNGRILKYWVTRNGYCQVHLSINGKTIGKTIHTLVAEAFLNKSGNKNQVNHINGIKTDNRVENLEWCTCSENIKHSFDLRLRFPTVKPKLTKEMVLEIRKKYVKSKYGVPKIAKEYNMSNGAIQGIIKKTTWKNV